MKFAWLLAASLKPRQEVFDNSLWPKTVTPQNYVEVWNQLPLLSWIGNSVIIALLAAGLVAISSSIVAFGFAYFKFAAIVAGIVARSAAGAMAGKDTTGYADRIAPCVDLGRAALDDGAL